MDRRQSSPSTARNREPILAVLRRVLPSHGHVLEIASGSGEHAVFFARAMPGLTWQTSDLDADARASTADWIESEKLPNVLPPHTIDVRDRDWNLFGPFDAVVSINMIHIAPWEAALGLLEGAGRLLRDGGVLFLYGPYRRAGAHTAPSNETFDQWLKARDPSFGVRDLEEVVNVARQNGLAWRETVEMPANNLSVIFSKVSSAS